MKKLVDLHMHSIYSDGSNTPEELINLSLSNNIGTISLTDHDCIEGSKEIVKLNKGRLTIYSGIELTIKAPKGRFHLLGYNIDLENPELNKVLKEQKESSIYNVLLYIEILRKDFNISIPQEEIDNLLSIKGNIGRPQIAILLVKLGYCTKVQEVFDKYLIYAYEKVRHVKKGLTEEEGVSLISNAKGIPIIAHPNSLKLNYQELKDKILYLKSLGLQGLETIHPNLSPEERLMYQEICHKYNLLESGGTDFHGPTVKPDIKLGRGRNDNVYIEENTLSLTKKINSRY